MSMRNVRAQRIFVLVKHQCGANVAIDVSFFMLVARGFLCLIVEYQCETNVKIMLYLLSFVCALKRK